MQLESDFVGVQAVKHNSPIRTKTNSFVILVYIVLPPQSPGQPLRGL